jgi:DNA repair protein RAD50
MWGPD